jgi:hypothetical protein
MNGLLAEFLRDVAAKRFRLGQCDCALVLADWWMFLQSQLSPYAALDPAAHLRGHYRSRLGYTRLVRRSGGLVAVVDSIANAIGAVRTEDPLPGDFAVVSLPLPHGEAGAIKVDMGWAMKLNDGITVGPAPCLAAWRTNMGGT